MYDSFSGVVAGHDCPVCGGRIVYNGNYYCGDHGPLCWAMTCREDGSHSNYERSIMRDYMTQRRDETDDQSIKDTMQFYLDRLAAESAA